MSETKMIAMTEALKRYNLSQDCVVKLIKRHNVPHERVGPMQHGKRWLVDQAAMDAVVAAQRIDEAAIGEEWFTTSQVRAILGIGNTTLDAMIGAGRIKRRQILRAGTNHRINIFHRDEVERVKPEVTRRKSKINPREYWRVKKAPLLKLVQITFAPPPNESDLDRKIREAAEFDATVQQEMPVEVIYRRGLAVRLLHTSHLIDGQPNPHYLGRICDRDEMEEMLARIESGEIRLTVKDLPVIRTLGRDPVGTRIYHDRRNGPERVLSYAGSC